MAPHSSPVIPTSTGWGAADSAEEMSDIRFMARIAWESTSTPCSDSAGRSNR